MEYCIREFSELLLIKDPQSFFRATNVCQFIKVNLEFPQGFPFQTAALNPSYENDAEVEPNFGIRLSSASTSQC